ncbi:hypothetical protein NL676_008770 [Syzygium grande]|nr:hypothetical protein NL676_008770 [Syzygium grande]
MRFSLRIVPLHLPACVLCWERLCPLMGETPPGALPALPPDQIEIRVDAAGGSHQLPVRVPGNHGDLVQCFKSLRILGRRGTNVKKVLEDELLRRDDVPAGVAGV